MSESVVIVSAQRTPMGGFMGGLSSMSSPELASVAIKSAMSSCQSLSSSSKTSIDGDLIDEVILGCVLSAGLGQAPARQAMLGAGLPTSVGASTLNKVCGSGMKAVMLAHDLVKAGSANAVLAGGMESMSQAPYLLQNARGGFRMGHQQALDHMMHDGLQNAYDGQAMGCFAQETADELGITRELMDEFAVNSLTKAQHAIDKGLFESEIAPVEVSNRRGSVTIDTDEGPGNARIDKIPNLRPAFKKDGTVTAANSSSISDGAAALLIMSEKSAQENGLKPLARIVAHSTNALLPQQFTLAPVGAIEAVLKKANWKQEDVDLFEINEAFAMVTMLAIEQLKLDASKVNIRGGACALGHPIGASGARIIVSLLHALAHENKTKGVASLCIGGGEATALAVEMLR